MVTMLLLVFLGTLFFLVTAGRLATYIQILFFHGIILFAAAFFSLPSMHTANLVFIMVETIAVKALAVPLFLGYILRRNNITQEAEPLISTFSSLVIMACAVILIFFMSYGSGNSIFENLFFVVSLSTVFTGLFLIITRRKIITHVMGYLVIENGVFILSLAVGNEMAMMVNLGVLLDVLVSVLTLGIFINRIGDVFQEGDVAQLRSLRD